MMLTTFICFVISAISVNAGVLPVDKCNLEDSVCLTDAFQKAAPVFMAGIPDLGIDVLDPLDMEDFTFDLSGLQFGLKDGKLKGLKSMVFEEVKWNLKKNYFDVVFHIDGSVKGHYTANGRLLILPITGDGQFKLKLKNVQMKFRIEYEMEKNADNKDVMAPKKYSIQFDVKDNAHFTLTNLFNGNKELSDTMLNFMNENWKQISQEFGKPMIEAAAKVLFKNIITFMTSQPIEEIANV